MGECRGPNYERVFEYYELGESDNKNKKIEKENSLDSEKAC